MDGGDESSGSLTRLPKKNRGRGLGSLAARNIGSPRLSARRSVKRELPTRNPQLLARPLSNT